MTRQPVANNDNTPKTPRTALGGPTLSIDFPDLRIGLAEYDEGPTGCTVFIFPSPCRAVADVRGGSPGVINANLPWDLDAICLTGGSGLGLQAVFGVTDELFSERLHTIERQPVVGGSVIYDFVAKGRSNIYPDRELGRAAARTSRPGSFPLGGRGAGRSATCGKVASASGGRGETSGQGAAFARIGPGRVAVFVVVNSLGVIVDRRGSVVRGNVDVATGNRSMPSPESIGRTWEMQQAFFARQAAEQTPNGNTTLTVVITDLRVEVPFMQQFARQVHSSMARAIQPFNAPDDGDVLWAVSTGRVDNEIGPTALAVAASELAWDAVLSSMTGLDDPGPFESRWTPD